MIRLFSSLAAMLALLAAAIALPNDGQAQNRAAMERVPDRAPGEGVGPFGRMLIRGATLIDGTGAPPEGPVDMVVENNRINILNYLYYYNGSGVAVGDINNSNQLSNQFCNLTKRP